MPSHPRALVTPPRALGAAALGVAAVAVRGAWIPFQRHRYDGHELDYLRIFQGEALGESTRLYPTLAWLYRQLGRLSDDPNLLLWLALVFGVLTVGAAGLAAGRQLGERAGWVTAALIAASPAHAFWSTSAYNVALPQLLIVSALAARGWVGAGLYAAACLFRVELALLAPAVALMAGPRAAAGALGGLAMLPLLETAPPLHGPLDVLPANLLLPDFLGPLGAPLGLVVVALAVNRGSWRWLAAAGWVHLVGACFDDYGWRHGLTGGVALAGVVAAVSWEHRRPAALLRRACVPAALVLSLLGCREVARWYYAPQSTFEDMLAERTDSLGPPPECAEIQDDPLAPESHWNDWPDGPDGPDGPDKDVCWREEAIHYAWNSRGLMARRLRMRRLYTLTPIGVARAPSGSRIYYAVSR